MAKVIRMLPWQISQTQYNDKIAVRHAYGGTIFFNLFGEEYPILQACHKTKVLKFKKRG